MSSKQVIITSALDCNLWTVLIQDLLTGTNLRVFKEGIICSHNCLDLVADQYLMVGHKDVPLIHFWSLNTKNTVKLKMKCPDSPSALTITPDGLYAIIAIGEKIYIYMTSSGDLCAILERHYQQITCVRMSSCGSFFISGGEDGIVLLWLLFHVLTDAINSFPHTINRNNSNHTPFHTWSHHTGKVTDIVCGYTGINGRCATVSLDSTCKVYDIRSGEMLASITFDCPLWSVAIDPAQNFLFVGGDNGLIYETNLFEKKSLMNLEDNRDVVFKGHESKVTNLAFSIDGVALVSGSYDGKVIVWHILSKQCMKTFEHKGAITNLIVSTTPRGLFDEEAHLLPIQPLKLSNQPTNDLLNKGLIKIQNNQCDHDLKNSYFNCDLETLMPVNHTQIHKSSNPNSLQQEIDKLKLANHELYKYTVDNIFKAAFDSNK